MKIPFLLLSILLPFFGFSQAPSIEWQKSLGGSDADWAPVIQRTSDGGFIVAGTSVSNDADVLGNHGLEDYWILKLDSHGNIVWQKCLGGSGNETALAIDQTIEGGYIVSGWSLSNDDDVSGNHGGTDYWISKLDSSGNILWQKFLGGSHNEYGAYSIQQTSDAGFILAGRTQSNDGNVSGWHNGENEYNEPAYDYWIVKLDANGDIDWEKCFGGSRDDYAFAAKQTQDGGFIITGNAKSVDGDVSPDHGYADLWVIKLDLQGNLLWEKSYGHGGQISSSLEVTTDGGFVVAAASESNYWILKADSLGNLLWQKSYGGSDGDSPYSIAQTVDGGYCIAGLTTSNDQDVTGWHQAYDNFGDPLGDGWIIKLDNAGELQWEKCLGGSNGDLAYMVKQTFDEGFIVACSSSSIDGDVTENHGNVDYWIVKLSAITGIQSQLTKEVINIFPSPTFSTITLSLPSNQNTILSIFNLFGEKVKEEKVSVEQVTIDVSELPAGVYMIRSQESTIGKFVKE